MDDELAGFILKAYAIYPKGHPREGRRRYHRAFLSRPKGRAKSSLAAWIACAEALGPVRFSHWDDNGEPVGRAVTSPEILILATEEQQTGNTYDVIYQNLHSDHCSEALRKAFGKLDVGLGRINIPGGGDIQPATAGAVSKDGGRSTYVVFDEVHHWHTPQLKNLYNMVRRNLGKRKDAEPWAMITSTMYRPGQGSVAESLHEAWKKAPDATLLFDHREGPDCDLDDDDQLRASLAYAYGPAAEWIDLERLIEEEFRDGTVDIADSQRYFLNQVVHSSEDWIDIRRYDACTDETITVDPDDVITLGFDGSHGTDGTKKADSTVLRGCRVRDGHLFTIQIWEHPEHQDDWQTPRDEVHAAVAHAFDTFNVWRLAADPAYWRQEADTWAATFGEDKVYRFEMSNDRAVARALERLQSAITQGSVTHDDDLAVRAHYANARKQHKRTRSGTDDRAELVLVRKTTPKSALKIDAVIADALALDARADAITSGALEPPKQFITAGFGGGGSTNGTKKRGVYRKRKPGEHITAGFGGRR